MQNELAMSGQESGSRQPPGKGWRRTRSDPVVKEALQLLALAILAVASYFFFSHFVLQTVEVVGTSMKPTLRDSDRYILNRWTYYVRPPQRSDIVVVKDPTDGAFVVKRIVAMPGETVRFKDGRVYVDNRLLSEPYLLKAASGVPMDDEHVIVCGRGQYVVLGDNREQSFDSRNYGPVRREQILGAVMR